MPLTSGSRLGPYEVLSLLGAGGMGEVYKAKDTRLNRIVAIKVLPSHLSHNVERRQRFEREAQAVSSLNHPHICALYDIGEQEGVAFLVMEHLEGETLGNRLKRGALPLDQALRYGIQIADALDKAHRQAVVHRDLKPGNVMLTKPGAKLLDFGLAKFSASDETLSALSGLPTQEKPLTDEGTIVGTFQYMAPEQLEGKQADARTDIFAFGALLYEMLTGHKAFEGKSQASLISAIMSSEPRPIVELQPMTPPLLDRLTRRCLEKDPDERWQTAKDLAAELEWVAEGNTQEGVPRNRKRLTRTMAFLAVVAGLALAAVTLFRTSAPVASVQKFSVLPPENAMVWSVPQLSPDGQRLAFVAADDSGRSLLWVRPLDSLTGLAIAGTEGAGYPFWSPDSRSVGFFTEGKLKTVALLGAPPETICDVGPPGGRGGTWSSDGVIVFASDVLYRVSVTGGTGGSATPVSTFDSSRGEQAHRWPYFLPDGRHFLYTARSLSGEHSILVGSLDSEETTHLLSAFSNMAYAPPGYLLFARDGSLMAQRFDLSRFELRGEPTPLAQDLWYVGVGLGAFSVSDNGILSFASGHHWGLTWWDRTGQRIESLGDPSRYCLFPSLSPDEERIAMSCLDPRMGNYDIWTLDLSRGVSSRLTFAPEYDGFPVWSPDGKRIVFRSGRDVVHGLYETAASGAGQEKLLLRSEAVYIEPTDWSPNGELILYETLETDTKRDLWLLPLTGSREPEPFLQTPFNEADGSFSPDGRWVAYTSDESGRYEVYVQSFPIEDQRHQISTNGGRGPVWRRDGAELFYIGADQNLMAVPVKAEKALDVGTPRALFRVQPVRSYSRYGVTADGQKVVMISPSEDSAAGSITVVLNWTAELER